MDTITICDLEVFYCVGVPDEERAKPQRLLLTVEMEHDFRAAASEDELADTIDYHAVTQRLRAFGDGVHWHLIETLAVDAPDNCWVQAYLTDGRREAQSFRVPDVALCKKLAEHHCSSRQQLAGCTASFASAGQAAPIALFEAAPSAPAEAAAPSDEATAPR